MRVGVARDFLERQPWAVEDEDLGALLRPCHHPHAVHLWHPARGLDASTASWIAVNGPHPGLLSGMVFAGEAVSLKQGWIEGAIETADAATGALVEWDRGGMAQHSVVVKDEEAEARRCVEYDGWLVDVEAWSEVHPGTKRAIDKFLGGKRVVDVTEVFRHVNHSADASRVMAALRVGFRDCSGAWRIWRKSDDFAAQKSDT